MQDNATAHTTNHSVNEINQVFGVSDCVVSRGLWPPQSPDLNPCDFYLWGKLKDKVYVNNPHTLDELKDNIRVKISREKNSAVLLGTFLEGVRHACKQRVTTSRFCFKIRYVLCVFCVW
jgi:hypothetical protein